MGSTHHDRWQGAEHLGSRDQCLLEICGQQTYRPAELQDSRIALDGFLERVEELGSRSPVDQAVIEGQAQHTGGTNLDLSFIDNRSFADPAHSENRRLPRIDYGREGVDSVGAEVGKK